MSDVINLRAARKARARKEREQVAAANRLKFGRTRAERDSDAQESLKHGQAMDAHRLDKNGEEDRE